MSSKLPEPTFEVRNLGAVNSGKFTHKPLTIFCGPNNSGKTWTLYSLYSAYKLLHTYAVELNGANDTLFPELDVLNEVMSEGVSYVLNSMDAATYEAQFHLIPSDSWEQELETLGNVDLFLLPAERSGLNLLFRELSTRRTALLHQASRLNVDVNVLLRDVISSPYPVPIADYIDWLNRMMEVQNPKGGQYHSHAVRLQRGLAGGSYRIDRETGSIQFRPYQSKNSGRKVGRMGLHVASGAVKSLFGLWCYLEYQAHPGSIIMIDEPELNIHPANQRQIARLLARLVNAGISVVISTHSDYIVREFNSLIMLHQKAGRSLQRKYRYRDDEVLDPKKVGAYLFDDHTIYTFTTTPEDGIHATTFDDVITSMNAVNNEIFFGLRRAGEAKGVN